MKSFCRFPSFILILSLWSCGQSLLLANSSEIREAPDARNSFQRMGIATKPYNEVRSTAQVNISQKYWSGFYWPVYQGGIAQRWQNRVQSKSYTAYLYPILSIAEYQQLSPVQMRRLSPAEKYDLWTNDPEMKLTNAEHNYVRRNAREYGDPIPTWFGICDGWALAASSEDEPLRMVRTPTAAGQSIEFYPEDIKALMAEYYSNARKYYVSAGGRCSLARVTKDVNGRVIEPECRDVNPATLHLALDRFVGDTERKMIIDVARDNTVWNHPVHSYRLQYSNFRRLSDDPSYQHAAPGTQYLINVNAQVFMVGGTVPTTRLSPQRNYREKLWRYVLELDGGYNIIGGEWMSEEHPDFIWIVQSVASGARLINYEYLSALAQASRLE